jgi:hypothetical protein
MPRLPWLAGSAGTNRPPDESGSRIHPRDDSRTQPNSDYNDLSIHATKTYHQLHESYPKDKFKNNDRHYQPCTDLHEKRNNPTQKQQTNPRQLHGNLTRKRTDNQKATLEIADQKASQHSHNLRICRTRRRLERSFVNWCIGIICNTSKHNCRCHSSLFLPLRGGSRLGQLRS